MRLVGLLFFAQAQPLLARLYGGCSIGNAIDRYGTGPQIERVYRSAVIVLCALLVVVPVGSAWADAVRLTSGQVIEGTIVEESQTAVVIATRNGNLVIARKDILEIENKGAARIVRLDVKRPEPATAALYSLIPFYSGLYLGDEPGLGVPLAIASGVYGLKLLNTLINRVPYTNWHSDSGRESLYTLSLLHVANQTQANASYDLNADPARHLLWAYDVLPLYPVAGYKVGSKFYEKHELRAFQRRTLQRYVLSAGLSAAAAYTYFRFLGPTGVSGLFSSHGPRTPTFVAVYALPTGEREWTAGAVFGF